MRLYIEVGVVENGVWFFKLFLVFWFLEVSLDLEVFIGRFYGLGNI